MKMKNIWVLLIWSLCQTLMSSSPVNAQDTSFCKFPFIYKGVRYTECTRAGDPNDDLWCSTKTDIQQNHIKSNWRQCTNCVTYPDKGSGKCMRVQNCESLKQVYDQVISGSSTTGLDRLRKSACGYEGKLILVCCPRETEPLCGGAVNSDRIVNGVNAALGAWPWMVLFLLRGKRSHCPSNNCPLGLPTWGCGGVLVNDRYVLTAAHCFQNQHIDFARIGEYNLKTNPDKNSLLSAPTPQDIDVENVIQHPSYGSFCSKCNDIALAKLQRSAQLHPTFVQPICLPPPKTKRVVGLSESDIQNRLATATGWGTTDANNPLFGGPADILQQANLTIQELKFCRDRKKSYQNRRMILCAGQGDGQDICRGDSGGPLMLPEEGGVTWYVVGISSFGATACGAKYAQGVFTSVHYYLDWINKNIS